MKDIFYVYFFFVIYIFNAIFAQEKEHKRYKI